MESQRECPLLQHELGSPSKFTPDELVSAVRAARGLPDLPVPEICVLDFDGDLTDWLLSQGNAMVFKPWACFHTKMYLLETDGACCGRHSSIGGRFGQFCNFL